jgi:hypothetical protein
MVAVFYPMIVFRMKNPASFLTGGGFCFERCFFKNIMYLHFLTLSLLTNVDSDEKQVDLSFQQCIPFVVLDLLA